MSTNYSSNGKHNEKEKDILLTIGQELAFIREKHELLPLLKKQFKRLSFQYDICISKVNEHQCTYSLFVEDEDSTRKDHPDYDKIHSLKRTFPNGMFEVALQSDNPVIFDINKLMKRPDVPADIKFIYENGTVEMVGVALRDRNKEMAVLFISSDKKNSFNTHQLNLIREISNLLAPTIANIIANEKIERQIKEIQAYKNRLEEENIYFKEQIKTKYNSCDIIGSGKAMKKVFHLISQVAFTNSTVLLQGETGTGKELIARAIHENSSRGDKTMIKVNCAALPANLIESELFGHERGSFTGAIERRIGKFELANKSSLFLDEIGEMPLDLQVKLLRVLQEKEIERVGGKSTIKTDVRIISATNKNLQKEVQAGRFRQDLFYRLNVFPITLPPLRNRTEDIPALSNHFIDQFSKDSGKKITGISKDAMQQLLTYNWPGNVRELENVIERSVLLTNTSTLEDVYLPQKDDEVVDESRNTIKTIEENERSHLLRVLKISKGKVSGKGGAAELLDVPPSTLNSKIKKLGIQRKYYSTKQT